MSPDKDLQPVFHLLWHSCQRQSSSQHCLPFFFSSPLENSHLCNQCCDFNIIDMTLSKGDFTQCHCWVLRPASKSNTCLCVLPALLTVPPEGQPSSHHHNLHSLTGPSTRSQVVCALLSLQVPCSHQHGQPSRLGPITFFQGSELLQTQWKVT